MNKKHQLYFFNLNFKNSTLKLLVVKYFMTFPVGKMYPILACVMVKWSVFLWLSMPWKNCVPRGGIKKHTFLLYKSDFYTKSQVFAFKVAFGFNKHFSTQLIVKSTLTANKCGYTVPCYISKSVLLTAHVRTHPTPCKSLVLYS